MNQGIYGFPGLLPPTIVPYIDFNLNSTYPSKQGRLIWDSSYSTLLLGLTSDVNAELGQSLYKKIRNNTGNTLTKGSVVYINGSHGQSNITVALADASFELTAATTIGVVAHTIANNTEGFIITQGYLRGIRTNNTTGTGGEGSILWLSETAGSFTYDRPTAPAHGVVVGWMVKSAGAGSGSIFVSITNGQELNELHDVYINGLTGNDILQWDSNDLRWENRSLATAGIASINHTHTLSGLTPLNQMTLVGRWASAGSGIAQEVTIGNGLKLSNGGILSTNSLQVVDTTTTLTAGLGLTGGGDLSTNRSFAVDFALSGTSSGTQAVRADDSRLSNSRTPTAHTHTLSDITQSGASSNQVPQWNGTNWVPATISGGGGGGFTPIRTAYTTTTTGIAIPSGATIIRIIATGGGGGGGGGCLSNNSSTNRCGGAGGGGGSVNIADYMVSNLSGTLTVTIGTGGTAGGGAITNGSNGSAGLGGGTTSVTATYGGVANTRICWGFQGQGGAGGNVGNTSSTGGSGGTQGYNGAQGGNGSNTTGGIGNQTSGSAGLSFGAYGGGGGGGLNTSNTQAAGGGCFGMYPFLDSNTNGGTAGGGAGPAATDSRTTTHDWGRVGGSGGGSSSTGAGGAGGNGLYGSGGGGGGAGFATNGGTGGTGGSGLVIIYWL